jgi:WD40 repeat protein
MNCKAAEGQLSAYLDSALDPTVRAEIETHLEQCANCGSLLAEYRYFDGLLRGMPRFEPSEGLRARIFDSPEFADILREVEGTGAEPSARWPVFSRPAARARAGDAPAAGHDRPLEPLPIPAKNPAPAGVGRRHGSAPPWARVAASVAAAIVVLAGSALLLKQGLSHSDRATHHGISSVAAYPNQTPLAAGPRVVYQRDGALWSAPDHGAGAARQLTPQGEVVGEGWVVAPARDAVAYIDETTGALHIIASNDQRDHVVGAGARLVARAALGTIWSSPEGQAILSGLVWSPDGTQIAYLSDPSATGQVTLRVAPADGTRTPTTISPAGAGAARAAWSPDGTRVAWVQTDAAGQSVWDYNLATSQMRRLGDSGRDAAATVRTLAWLSADQGPAVTWATADPASGRVSGIYLSQVLQGTDARPLTAGGQNFTAAAFTATAGGLWLLSDGSATYQLAPLSGTLAPVAGLPGGAATIAWSPDGALAVVVSTSGDLRVWARGEHSTLVTSGVSLGVPLAWSPDGSALGFVSQGQLALAHLAAGSSAGVSASVTVVSSLTSVTSIAWSPDGTAFAAGGDDGVTRGLADGTALARVDTHAARGAVVWSVAR